MRALVHGQVRASAGAVPDPFATLGLSPSFDLDLGEAERRHRDLSKTLHPDRYAGRPAAERRQALGKAIEVNEAWRTLRDPIRRREALLDHLGIHVEEGEEPKPDAELLMEMMELREELAEAAHGKNVKRLAELIKKVKTREVTVLSSLSAQFTSASEAKNGDAAESPTGGFDPNALMRTLGELRYYRRFLDEAAAYEDELL